MTRSPDTDQLLALAQTGDPSARSQLLTRHSTRLLKMIAAFLDPRLSARVDATDILQEALARASDRLPDYLQKRPIGFYPWLRQIVQEEMITAHRRHLHAQRRSVKRENGYKISLSGASAIELAGQLISNDSTPSHKAKRQETRSMMKKALSELSEADRQILVMRYVEQLKIGEISEILEVSEASAKSRVRRALERLSHCYGNGHGGETKSK